jgi:hypothetical protein
MEVCLNGKVRSNVILTSRPLQYLSLATHAIKILLPFSDTHLCVSGFSTLVQLKSKQRNRLDAEHDLRVALSTITPDFEILIRINAHPQLSH